MEEYLLMEKFKAENSPWLKEKQMKKAQRKKERVSFCQENYNP